MRTTHLFRILYPQAPGHKRTESDIHVHADVLSRVRSAKLIEAKPGLQSPSLVSSYKGSINRILFSFPKWVIEDIKYVNAYKSVIGAFRKGTHFIIIHHLSINNEVKQWVAECNHEDADVTYIEVPDFVNLTDWAEDAYVSLKDAADNTSYLMEPWEFQRAGDALIADAVEEHTEIRASQSPLIFQGGNCLIGDDFWLIGRDYFADTIQLLNGSRPPVAKPDGVSVNDFAISLFKKYLDSSKKLVVVGTKKQISMREIVGSKEQNDFYVDIVGDGVGTFQPIFHIDMFISLVGRNLQGKFQVLVGSPKLADDLLGRKSTFALNEVYDTIANDFATAGFTVLRNPIVHWPTKGDKMTFGRLKQIASQPGNESLTDTIVDLGSLGAKEDTNLTIRNWHHITWNNCLVENSSVKGRNVYLPTFGHGKYQALSAIDSEMKSIWESLGFNVFLLGDFNPFAERQGVVHCIKKYIDRDE